MFVLSCNKSTDCYSCDVDVDAFVKQNETELREMSVTELAGYNPEVQRAVFRMYDASKKQKIWEEKYSYILANNPNHYSEEELAAIRTLFDYVIEKGIDKTDNTFVYQWIMQTREDFVWSDHRYRFLIMSLEVDEASYRKNYGTKPSSEEVNCKCNGSKDGLLIGDCPPSGECSTALKCKETKWGCGIWWQSPCNGDCQPEGGYPERVSKN